MTDSQFRRFVVPDRARRRAIRMHAALTGVPYMEAARQMGGRAAGMMSASRGRTIYPCGTDGGRQELIDARYRFTLAERIADVRLAADLPAGRATHLVSRFPALSPGHGVGVLYGGYARAEVLALLYLVVIHERPDLEPDAADLAWEAEMGEETAVDTACAQLDRAVRLLLDDDRRPLLLRIDAATQPVALQRNGTQARALAHRPISATSIDGARQTLDALLMVADDGHAPGTRVRLLLSPGVAGTIVGARWGLSGPPTGYRVQLDGPASCVAAEPWDLAVLAGQGSE